MTPPESTRRAMRERKRLRAERATADPATLPAFGDSLGPELATRTGTALAEPDAAPAPRDGADAEHPGSSSQGPAQIPAPQPGAAQPGAPQPGTGHSDAVIASLIGASAASAEAAPPEERPTEWADESRPPTALTWLDASTLLDAPASAAASAPLFAGARLTPEWRRPRVLVPVGIVAALCAGYVSTTLLWPLSEVAPQVQAATVEIAPAPPAAVMWPVKGSAAVGIQGMQPVASTAAASEIASISKVVSVMMVLDKLPLEVGEQGPSFAFTEQDARDYWGYRRSNQSSLDVPVGASLTEYQMLQGIMLGSANNYIDRLAREIWGSERAFAEASAQWLSDRGIEDVAIPSPSGFSSANVASPASLIQIAELAMAHPVFAEIVATRTADIPGVGVVTNTNKMLDDPGVVGVKTGTLTRWNLLTAKDVTVGDTTVRLFASVLGQDSSAERVAETRQLLAGVEKTLADQAPSVPEGTVVGRVTTEWGDDVAVVTDSDARVLLWNGSTATAATEFALNGETNSGDEVGTLTAQGPLGTASTSVSLADDLSQPSIWWRLTHPLELFGLDKD